MIGSIESNVLFGGTLLFVDHGQAVSYQEEKEEIRVSVETEDYMKQLDALEDQVRALEARVNQIEQFILYRIWKAIKRMLGK